MAQRSPGLQVLLMCLSVALIRMFCPAYGAGHEPAVIEPDHLNPGLWGSDTRTLVPGKYAYLKRKIGRLTVGGARKISCTVFCVEDDTVATAAHCLFSTDGKGEQTALSSFAVEFSNGEEVERTKIAGTDETSRRWNVLAGTTHFPRHSPLHNARDWALLKLATNICAKRILPVLPIRREQKLLEAVHRRQLFTIGFMRRRSEIKLLYSGACESTQKLLLLKKVWTTVRRQFLDPVDIIPHRCGFGPGASGSPLFLAIEEGAAVIALNNGSVQIPRHLLTGKSPDDRRALIRAMPEASNIAVSAAAFVQQIGLMQDLPQPIPRAAISRLQRFLGKLGYFAKDANGSYDPDLRQAILDFERDRGLIATGLPSLSLIGR